VRFPGLTFEFRANARIYETSSCSSTRCRVDGGIRLECQYNRDLHDAASVRRWMLALGNAAARRGRAAGARAGMVAAGQRRGRRPELAALQPARRPTIASCARTRASSAGRPHAARTAVRGGGPRSRTPTWKRRSTAIAHWLRGQDLRPRRPGRVGAEPRRGRWSPRCWSAQVGRLRAWIPSFPARAPRLHGRRCRIFRTADPARNAARSTCARRR